MASNNAVIAVKWSREENNASRLCNDADASSDDCGSGDDGDYNIYIYIYNFNCMYGSVDKASDIQSVGRGFEPRPDH